MLVPEHERAAERLLGHSSSVSAVGRLRVGHVVGSWDKVVVMASVKGALSPY